MKHVGLPFREHESLSLVDRKEYLRWLESFYANVQNKSSKGSDENAFHPAEEHRKYKVNIEPEIFQQQLTQRFQAVAAVFGRAVWFPRDSV